MKQKLPDKFTLAKHNVDYFVIDMEKQDFIDESEALTILSSDEFETRLAHKNHKARANFTINRSLLRVLIESQTGFSRELIPISYHRYGKPFINQNPIYFNLSHSGTFIIYVFSKVYDVGVDIEKVNSIPDETEAAHAVLGVDEYLFYENLGKREASIFFYRCWTAKEAYLKLLGLGLQIEPRCVCLELKNGRPISAITEGYVRSSVIYLDNQVYYPYIACIAVYHTL